MTSSSGRSPSPEGLPTRSLGDERERVVQELTTHFAEDRLTMDELETRLERAYKCGTLAELRQLVADLPAAGAAHAPVPVTPRLPVEPLALAPERERIFSVMSETKRRGAWPVPQRLDLVALMSDTTIDLTQTQLPPGIVDIRVRSLCAAVKIIVPPGVQVVSRVSSLMASVHGASEPQDASKGLPAWRSETVIRLTGWAVMAEVQTKVRRREEDDT